MYFSVSLQSKWRRSTLGGLNAGLFGVEEINTGWIERWFVWSLSQKEEGASNFVFLLTRRQQSHVGVSAQANSDQD